ncbi:DUF4222 domain-containing protein [Citrobacter braakii]|uniref:DUF4222 domain-containing protein n=1 Tax=Citrobacter braakii TaxID=57706 RepID=UPI002B24A250|nr:DUF4222 domain-containing protein [Citrobacter braakii]MEB0968395.1 DUF4222 domain-containing protein [Citrobacter braakii]
MFDEHDIPSPRQRYKDDRGVLVTIVNVEDRRVVFIRDGYPHLCMRPIYNFMAKFKKIAEEEEQPSKVDDVCL